MKHHNKPGWVLARGSSAILLVIIGITALLGGSALIIDPSGQSMNLNIEGLAGTIFEDYMVPGIILFLLIGVLSLSAAMLVFSNFKYFPVLIFYQGLILTGWIMVQIYLMPDVHMMQVIYGLFGIMLMFFGSYFLIKKNQSEILY